MKLAEQAIISIVSAEHRTGYRIYLKFSDGVEQTMDFGPFLRKSMNPMTRAYLDHDKFRSFSIKNGDLQWGNYDLCFPLDELYEGKI